MRDFRKYDIWLKAVDVSTVIYGIVLSFPKYEIFGLSDQLRRASVSISSNIAEGCSRDSEKDFAHFLEMSIGSAFEVESQMKIALNLQYIDNIKYENVISLLDPLEKQIHALIKKLRT